MKKLTHSLGVEFSSKPGWREGRGENEGSKGCGGVWYLENRGMKSIMCGIFYHL